MTRVLAWPARTRASVTHSNHPSDLAVAALLALAFLLLRLPFRSEYLVNWDAVQFALGTESFNLELHQPHPPGYIGYVATGWFLNLFTADPNTSLTLMSAVAGAATPALFYLLAMEVLRSRPAALAGALLLGTSPLAWYYSEVALTYMPETGIALGFILAAYRARTRHSWPALVAAALLLAVLGSFRQTGMVLLGPVYVWALWPFPWRNRIASAGITAVTTLGWLIPLLWLSDGLDTYLRESAALGELAGGPTSVVSGSPAGLGRNVVIVLTGLIAGLNAALALPLLGGRSADGGPREARHLLLLWSLPALAVYLLGHTGQAGYVLVLLPAAILALLLVVGSARDVTLRFHAVPDRRASAALVGLVLVNAFTFLWGPQALMSLSEAIEDPTPPAIMPEDAETPAAAAEGAFEREFRQFAIPGSDAYWEGMIERLEQYPADRSVVLTGIGGPRASGSFRHLSYYLRDFRVLGIAPDSHGMVGQVVSSYGGASDYSVHQLVDAHSVVALDPRVDRLLIPDPEIAALLDEELLVQYVAVEGGSTLAIAWLPEPSTLLFTRDDDASTRISYISQSVASVDR